MGSAEKLKIAVICFAVLCAVLLVLLIVFLIIGARYDHDVLFTEQNPEEGYVKNRIPGIIVTNKGTIITYYEARETNSDWACIDIVAYRSTDGAATFSNPIVLADGVANGKTVNNPVMVVSGDVIHFLYCVEYSIEERGGGVYYRQSVDDGVTFSPAVEIGTSIGLEGINAFALGPGHGIEVNGALIIPVWYVKAESGSELTSHHPAIVSTLYSLDNGVSWQMGEDITKVELDGNESVAALLSNGKVILNIRKADGVCRAVAYSDNGYSGWSEAVLDENLPDNSCFGSVATYGDKLLFVNCATTRPLRNKLTVRVSDDYGTTWKSRVLERGLAGYADIICDDSGNVYVAYEVDGGRSAMVAKLSTEWIEDGGACAHHNTHITVLGLALVFGVALIPLLVLFLILKLGK